MDIYLNDYLHCGDNVLAVSEALRDCREGDTLHLGGGTLELYRTYAVPVNYYLPRYSDESKFYAVYAEEKKDIVIDGDGASLILAGDISGFGFEKCENLTLRNFSIDYKHRNFWQAMITETNEKYFEVEFDEAEYPCEYDSDRKVYRFGSSKSGFCWESGALLANEFDPLLKRPSAAPVDYFLCAGQPHHVYDFMSVLVDTECIASNRLRFYYKNRTVQHTVGNYLVLMNHERRNTNIHLHKCKNVTLENIDMYSSFSFGVVALLVENLNIRNVNSILQPDFNRMIALNADMFHCVNCSGNIEIAECRIENMGDDAINIHSLLCKVKKVLDSHSMLVEFPYLAKRALNLFTAGEKLHRLNEETFERGVELTVRSSEFAGQYHLRIETREELRQDIEGSILESTDAMPKIYIHDCATGNNRGRGFLVSSSRHTVVENNTFYNPGFSICVGGASRSYMEGGAVDGLIIRHNSFVDSAYKGSAAVNVNPQGINNECTIPYHKNISIVNNDFAKTGKTLINARLVKGLYIENNRYTQGKRQSSEETGSEEIKLQQCVDVEAGHAFISSKDV